MSRWIVFDEQTADAVQSRCGLRPEVHADERGEILQMVLQSRAAVAVGPAPQSGKALLIRMTRPQHQATRQTVHKLPSPPPPQLTPPTPETPKPASNLAPAGFLGLTDSIDMDSEPESDRPKKWWQRILD
jgi:hypothetical protein